MAGWVVVTVVSSPPHTALMCSAPCSPGHHGSPLCQLGLLQSVSWAGSLCGEEDLSSGGDLLSGRPEGFWVPSLA